MGIYPDVTYKDVPGGIERITTTPGLTVREVFKFDVKYTERTDCYCCSCGEREGGDPYCRNHGFAGSRPCELHGMPGQPDEESGLMPMSVQAYRRMYSP